MDAETLIQIGFNTRLITQTKHQCELLLSAVPTILMGCTLSMVGRSSASFNFRWYSASASCWEEKIEYLNDGATNSMVFFPGL